MDTDVRQTAERAHQTITEAIRAGDPEAAERRMIRHVHTYGEDGAEYEERTCHRGGHGGLTAT